MDKCQLEKVEHVRKNKHGGPRLSSEVRLSVYEYEFLKSYLYAIYCGDFSDNRLEIFRCVTHTSLSHRPLSPTALDAGSSTFRIIGDGVLEVTLLWEGELYEINVSKETFPNDLRVHTVYCLGLSEGATSPKELLAHCLSRSVSNSFFRNETLSVTPRGFAGESIEVKPVHIGGRPLSHLFLPQECRDAIDLFVESLRRFDTIRKPLRYLLAGKPGTGKTETIRSIIEACQSRATFILLECACNLREVFQFASLFTPSVLCLDDIDLFCGDRHQSSTRESIGEFLTLVDGFQASNLFVLATTNDKAWVDFAASRPGRFDMVLDLDLHEPTLYLQLIHQRCSDRTLIELFDESVLNCLREKRVSGAFVVNLLKHLELKHAITPGVLDSTYVLEAVERMYRGFYKSPKNGERTVGFGTN